MGEPFTLLRLFTLNISCWTFYCKWRPLASVKNNGL